MTENNWETCPRCGSFKVKKDQKVGDLLVFLGIAIIGVFFWVMLLLPFIGAIGIVVGVFLIFISPFVALAVRGKLYCQECGRFFKPTNAG